MQSWSLCKGFRTRSIIDGSFCRAPRPWWPGFNNRTAFSLKWRTFSSIQRNCVLRLGECKGRQMLDLHKLQNAKVGRIPPWALNVVNMNIWVFRGDPLHSATCSGHNQSFIKKGIPIKRRCVLVALVLAVGCKCDDTKCSTVARLLILGRQNFGTGRAAFQF